MKWREPLKTGHRRRAVAKRPRPPRPRNRGELLERCSMSSRTAANGGVASGVGQRVLEDVVVGGEPMRPGSTPRRPGSGRDVEAAASPPGSKPAIGKSKRDAAVATRRRSARQSRPPEDVTSWITKFASYSTWRSRSPRSGAGAPERRCCRDVAPAELVVLAELVVEARRHLAVLKGTGQDRLQVPNWTLHGRADGPRADGELNVFALLRRSRWPSCRGEVARCLPDGAFSTAKQRRRGRPGPTLFCEDWRSV